MPSTQGRINFAWGLWQMFSVGPPKRGVSKAWGPQSAGPIRETDQKPNIVAEAKGLLANIDFEFILALKV
jgi:hypothetical protein